MTFFLESERLQRLSKESFWVVLGQTMTLLGSLVGVRLLTGILNPETYGELALGMTLATLVNQTVLGPLGSGATRFYAPAVEQGDLDGYLKAVGRLMLSATGIIALMTFLTVVGLLMAGRTEWTVFTIATFIFAFLMGGNSILNGIQNAARQRSLAALHQGMESWMRFLIATVFLLWLGATSGAAMIGFAVAGILVLGSQYLFFRQVIPLGNNWTHQSNNWQEQIWKFSWPISLFGIFTWVQLASDRWALELFATTQEVGLYAALFQLGYSPMSMASAMAMQLLAPIIYQRAGDASDIQRSSKINILIWRITWLTLGGTGLVFLIALLFHPQIFQVFVSREYLSVSFLMPWMLLAGGIFAAGQTIALNLLGQMKSYEMITPKIVTALLGVTLNFAGAYWYGIMGIVIAGVVFSLLYFLWMTALWRYEGIT